MNAVPPKIPPAPPRPDARLEGDRSDAELVGNTTLWRVADKAELTVTPRPVPPEGHLRTLEGY